MAGSLGARLKLQRERQGVALATIAETTKIKASLLEELERDDLSHWPAGIFRRSYVRAYAQAIGLEPDPVVREFLKLHPEPLEEDDSIEAIARTVDPAGGRRPPTRLSYLLSSAINALPSLRASGVQPPPRPVDTKPLDEPPLDEQPLLDFAHLASQPGFTEPASQTDPGDIRIALGDPSADIDAALMLDLEPSELDTRPDATMAPPDSIQAVDLEAIAELCTRLGRAGQVQQVEQFMERAAILLGAIGVILWTWDANRSALQPSLSHGYSATLLAYIPPVTAQSDNAIASAFRTTRTCIVTGDDQGTGAVAVPLMTPFGCAGVLAAEFRNQGEQDGWVQAALRIFGAQLSTLVGQPPVIRTA